MEQRGLAGLVTGLGSALASLVVLFVLPPSALATPGQPGTLDALEKYTRQLGRGPLRDSLFRAIDTPRLAVEIHPANKLMVVTRGFSQSGFSLGADNKLSPADRQQLERMIQEGAPETSPRSVARTVAAEARRINRYQRQLRGMDTTIGDLLRQAAKASRTQDQVLWKNGKAALVYSPSRSTLVGMKGFSQRGFFLDQRGGTLQVQSSDRDALRAFLLRHGPSL
jgi:hypothetical protein